MPSDFVFEIYHNDHPSYLYFSLLQKQKNKEQNKENTIKTKIAARPWSKTTNVNSLNYNWR